MSGSRTQLTGHVLTPQGFIRGTLTIVDGRIAGIEGHAISEGEAGRRERALDRLADVLPRLVDALGQCRRAGLAMADQRAAARPETDAGARAATVNAQGVADVGLFKGGVIASVAHRCDTTIVP